MSAYVNRCRFVPVCVHAGVVGALWVVGLLYRLLHPQPHKAAVPQKQVRMEYNKFKSSSSTFDTNGSLLRVWDASATIAVTGTSIHGWFNLGAILLVTWVFGNAVYNFQALGHIMADQGRWAWDTFANVSHLLLAIIVAGAYFMVASYTFVKLVRYNKIPERWQVPIQAVLELIQFFVPIFYIRTLTSWPFIQRLALGMETAVLLCKMQSYITTNAHLRLEYDLGLKADASSPVRVCKYPMKTAPLKAVPAPQPVADGPSHDEKPLVSGLQHEATVSNLLSSDQVSEMASTNEKIRHQNNRPRGDTLGSPVEDAAQPEATAHTTTSTDTAPLNTPSAPRAPNPIQVSTTASRKASTVGGSRWNALIRKLQLRHSKQVCNSEGEAVHQGAVTYPDNIHFKDFLVFAIAPTLVYEPNFPRTSTRRLGYIAEKLFLAIGLLFAAGYLVENYYRPIIRRMNTIEVFEAILALLIPTMFATLITFFVSFECILNAFAELTRFGDRHFYDDWYAACCSSANVKCVMCTLATVLDSHMDALHTSV